MAFEAIVEEGDPLTNEDLQDEDLNAEEIIMEGYMRDTVMSLHRTTMVSNEDIRSSSINSLVEMVKEDSNLSLLVLQTWLDQFSRTNFDTPDRILLLQSLMTITDNMTESSGESSTSLRLAVGRAVNVAIEEMTRSYDILDTIQLPCSKILVRFGSKNANLAKVMEAILCKFQPGNKSHFYIITTLSELATRNPTRTVPYLKAVLTTMLANMKTTKKDHLRYAYANAFSRFAEAILDYLANIDNTPDPSITKEHFVEEFDALHDILFTAWLHGKGMSLTNNFEVSKVKNAVIEALGCMGPMLSDERLYKYTANPVCSSLLGMYKKVPEPFYITACVSNLLKAMIERDVQIIDGIIEPLFTALFVQVCQFAAVSIENVDNFKRKNHYEVLRCYDQLIRSHPEKLISGLLLRLNSVDENIRVSTLIVFRHLMNSSLDLLQPRMSDIFSAFHSKLNETSNRVRKMLAQLTALLGSLGFLEGHKGRDFLEFIVKLSALPTLENQRSFAVTSNDILQYLTASDYSSSNYSIVTNANLREMCDNILQLLTKEALEDLLWPFLIDFLLAPEYVNAIPSVIKSLSQLAIKTRMEKSTSPKAIDYLKFKFVHGPYVIFARLLVLASVPVDENVLTFMQNFAPHINKHLSSLWDQRIPLLHHYLAQAKFMVQDQDQWEEWLLALMDDTLAEIDLDEWNNAFIGAMTQQLNTLYTDLQHQPCVSHQKQKAFLIKAMGRALKAAKDKSLISDTLGLIFNSTDHSDHEQQSACSAAFGFTSQVHLKVVVEKLESILKAEFGRKRGTASSFFAAFMRDHKLGDEQLQARCSILQCVGCIKAENLHSKADEICQKFIMPALQSNLSGLKVSALKATSEVAESLQQQQNEQSFALVHHQDLIHEAIECMKAKSWSLADKHIALATTLELVKLPPYVTQLTRCAILKACFTAIFPSLIRAESGVDRSNGFVLIEDNSNSSGQSTPTKGHAVPPSKDFLKPTLDKLLNLVQALLLQEPLQSTLDEIFTLLEPYLKLSEKLSREMSVTLLHATLRTFCQSHDLKKEEDEDDSSLCSSKRRSFSPGPYIIGSLIPRCFDTSRRVQSTALACLQLLIQISKKFREVEENGISEESENALCALDRISASCSPLTMSTFGTLDIVTEPGVSPALIGKTITNVLRLELSSEDILPLIHSLIEGLSDEIINSAKGSSMILCSILEHRGDQEHVNGQSVLLVQKLHEKLLQLSSEETKVRVLMAVRILASHNAMAVIDSLLDFAPMKDEALVNIWKSLTQDKTLASFTLHYLIGKLDPLTLVDKESGGKVAAKVPLASILALKVCFTMKEMESIVESEFAEIFVPLLLALGCYSAEPFEGALECLTAFLTCKGCHSIAQNMRSRPEDFGDFVAFLTESLCVDFPMYLPKVAAKLQDMPESEAISASFHAQLLLSEAVVETGLLDLSIGRLLMVLDACQGQSPTIRTVAVKGLAGYKIDTISKFKELSGHAPQIIRIVMKTIGDDFESDLNYWSLLTLKSMISAVPANVLLTWPTEIVSKISPFFNLSDKREAAAAIAVFGQLSIFMTDLKPNETISDVQVQETKELFEGLIHEVLVSLLLHINNEDVNQRLEIRQAARLTLLQVFKFYQTESLDNLCKNHLENEKKRLNYVDFLRDFAGIRDGPICEMFHSYIEKAMYYFLLGEPRLRANAVHLVTNLLVENPNFDNGEKVCQELSKLLSDGSSEVKIAAASNIGKVCLAVNKHKQS